MISPVQRRFGPYGGQFLPEPVLPALTELEQAWIAAREDTVFTGRLTELARDYAGRPTSLYLAERISDVLDRAVYLKREDLGHTGSHAINNALGQVLLARRMGLRRIVADTGSGRHGVATAAVCALLDVECTIYIGRADLERHPAPADRMRLLGAQVQAVDIGGKTWKEAVSAAIRDWIRSADTTYYLPGSAFGPAPYPALVRDLQRVIGDEAREQFHARVGRLPDRVVASVGGGSNAIGMFTAFLDDDVQLVGVEGAGPGDSRRPGSLSAGTRPGVLHGAYSRVQQDDDGQIRNVESVAAGLAYPGVSPEHAWLRDTGRVQYVAIADDDAVAAARLVSRLEGIVPALESAHAVAWLLGAGRDSADGADIVCLSGRGDE